ncbi:MAG TPA: glycoside hydrolase domain-containing protein, partial [Bacteroidota bacterium]|nr:glycoside hydrolase domain-containing protein [Bacteroidota bacterium]
MILCRHVLAAFPLLWCALGALASTDIQYSVADRPWPEGLGNQRAVISIPATAPAVRIQLLWRRHDAHVDQRRLLLVHAVNGDTISHIRRIRVDREVCDIVAGPVVHPGEYYLYYLSYDVVPGWGYYSGDYLPREFPAPQVWLREGVVKKEVEREAQNAAIPKARILGIQARTAF